jgi:glycosyltransferase involved in cell wall biosynthesis
MHPTQRKRIAFITNFITPYRVSFYSKLNSSDKYDWLVIHGSKKKDDGRPPYQGTLNFPNVIVGYKEMKFGPFYLRWQSRVLQQIQKWRPYIVINEGIVGTFSSWFTLIWARLNKSKNIIWHGGWESQARNPHILVFKKLIIRQFLKLADHIIVYSSKGRKYLESLGVPSEKITICFNGLEIDHLLDKETEYRNLAKDLREKEGVEEKKVFLYVGGMMEEKQILLLLQAYQELTPSQNAILWLVGDGPDLVKYKNFVRENHLDGIKFWGRIIDEVDILFAAADYFVLPGEGGLAINQALFWGLPCVVGNADGTEDDLVFEGKTGFRFIPEDVKSLKSALTRCIQLTEQQRKCFGMEGHDIVISRSNVNQMVNTFINTIENLINS